MRFSFKPKAVWVCLFTFSNDNKKTTHMNTAEKLFNVIDSRTRDAILMDIAETYDMHINEALESVTHYDSDHLLDLVAGPIRDKTIILIKRHGLSVTE